MKLFVVIGSWDYEGYAEPTGIYSTRELADAAAEYAKTSHTYDDTDVLEYDLDSGEREAAALDAGERK